MIRSGAIVLLGGVLAGCTSGEAPNAQRPPVRTVEGPGPVVIERAPDAPVEQGVLDPDSTEDASPDERERVRVFGEGEAVPRRDDGRPTWWLDSNERVNGRTRFCAEAIAGSILEARRAAVRRAETMSSRLGGSGEIEFLRIWVWPIRATGDIRPNYAVFVMGEVATPG